MYKFIILLLGGFFCMGCQASSKQVSLDINHVYPQESVELSANISCSWD